VFMGKAEEKEPLPVSLGMRAALGLSGLATLYIGVMPEQFIRLVNWSLGLAQNPAVARLVG
jgi:hypothetical protein